MKETYVAHAPAAPKAAKKPDTEDLTAEIELVLPRLFYMNHQAHAFRTSISFQLKSFMRDSRRIQSKACRQPKELVDLRSTAQMSLPLQNKLQNGSSFSSKCSVALQPYCGWVQSCASLPMALKSVEMEVMPLLTTYVCNPPSFDNLNTCSFSWVPSLHW